MKKLLILALIPALLAAAGADAGELTPDLADLMDRLTDQDEIKVLVVMADQPDIKSLDKSLRLERVSLAERHRTVVGTLQEAAAVSQRSLLKDLSAKSGSEGIAGFTPHWIVNAVVVRGTVAAIRDLALRRMWSGSSRTSRSSLSSRSVKPATLPAGDKRRASWPPAFRPSTRHPRVARTGHRRAPAPWWPTWIRAWT